MKKIYLVSMVLLAFCLHQAKTSEEFLPQKEKKEKQKKEAKSTLLRRLTQSSIAAVIFLPLVYFLNKFGDYYSKRYENLEAVKKKIAEKEREINFTKKFKVKAEEELDMVAISKAEKALKIQGKDLKKLKKMPVFVASKKREKEILSKLAELQDPVRNLSLEERLTRLNEKKNKPVPLRVDNLNEQEELINRLENEALRKKKLKEIEEQKLALKNESLAKLYKSIPKINVTSEDEIKEMLKMIDANNKSRGYDLKGEKIEEEIEEKTQEKKESSPSNQKTRDEQIFLDEKILRESEKQIKYWREGAKGCQQKSKNFQKLAKMWQEHEKKCQEDAKMNQEMPKYYQEGVKKNQDCAKYSHNEARKKREEAKRCQDCVRNWQVLAKKKQEEAKRAKEQIKYWQEPTKYKKEAKQYESGGYSLKELEIIWSKEWQKEKYKF